MPDPMLPPLGDSEIQEIERLLTGLAAPLEPHDVSGLDGFLCGSLLTPGPLQPSQWQPGVLDLEGRPAPAGVRSERLLALAHRRRQELDRAIQARQWFDPWVFEVEDATVSPAQMVQPWVSGLSVALDRFVGAPSVRQPAAHEPLAVLFSFFDAEDLEDVGVLQTIIDSLEPPTSLEQAVEDLVCSVLRLADVVRPVARSPHAPRRRTRTGR